MSDSPHGFGVLAVLLRASPTPTPSPAVTSAPASASDTGLLITLIVIIVLLAVGVAALLLQLRRPRGQAPVRGGYESARRPSRAGDKPTELDAREAELNARTSGLDARTAELDARTAELEARTAELEARTAELSRRGPADVGVAMVQRDVLAETCMDVADLVENDALAERLKLGLRRAGYEILAPTGGRFDPEVHEAFERRPTDDPALDRVVAATMRPGYRLDGQTIRYAKVVVYGVGPRSGWRG